jgi:hypothetical protein
MRLSIIDGLVVVPLATTVLLFSCAVCVGVATSDDSTLIHPLISGAALGVVAFILLAPIWLLLRIVSYLAAMRRPSGMVGRSSYRPSYCGMSGSSLRYTSSDGLTFGSSPASSADYSTANLCSSGDQGGSSGSQDWGSDGGSLNSGQDSSLPSSCYDSRGSFSSYDSSSSFNCYDTGSSSSSYDSSSSPSSYDSSSSSSYSSS